MNRFIADTMLGRLSTWLRIIGYDTLYFKDIDDASLLRLAREEGRVILTRDTLLLKRREIEDYVFIKDNEPINQLKQVIAALSLKTGDNLFSRCTRCNEILISIEKKYIEDLVPEYVFQTNNTFTQCRICRRVYWKGTHFKRMEDRLKRLLDNPPYSPFSKGGMG
ncbi:MAG: Mut7-C RNAse domain-containing protein [Nitrospirae bacterium]|nr:Mut7-C RNAse domain-containing protein [Nitrospirota bacterium]